MVVRIWHGWTTPENADKYKDLLKKEIFPGIAAKNIKGYLGIELFRRYLENEVEFITMMRFTSLDAVKEFVGEDYEKCYVPPSARKVLSRFDERSLHYELIEEME